MASRARSAPEGEGQASAKLGKQEQGEGACSYYREQAARQAVLAEHVLERQSVLFPLEDFGRTSPSAYSDELLEKDLMSNSLGPINEAAELKAKCTLLEEELHREKEKLQQLEIMLRQERSSQSEQLELLKIESLKAEHEAFHLREELQAAKAQKETFERDYLQAKAALHCALEATTRLREDERRKSGESQVALQLIEREKRWSYLEILLLQKQLAKAEAEANDRRAEVQELQSEIQRQKETGKVAFSKLEEMEQFLTELNQELSAACMDPLLMQPMIDPVLAADLHTYDRKSIEAWHKVSPTSPFSRAPLEITTLRRNGAAMQLAEVNKTVINMYNKIWPAKALPVAEARTVLPVLVKFELVQAIASGKEDVALELLAREGDDGTLNGSFLYKGQDWTLLELALVRQLPRAAQAIAIKRDFRRGQCSNDGVYPIHLAAALGYGNVCQSLIDDLGPSILTTETHGRIAVDLPSGETLTVPKWISSWDLARRFKHESLLALFGDLSQSSD